MKPIKEIQVTKSQEALEEIKNGGTFEDLKGAIETLQQLIDNYSKLEQEHKELLDAYHDCLHDNDAQKEVQKWIIKYGELEREHNKLKGLQTPKYVIYEPISIGGGDGHLDACIGAVAYCPTCNEEVYFDTCNDYRSEYCDGCGQRLKWR